MGTVWRANDTLLRRDVAVKEVVLPPGLAPSDRDAMYERTLREARAAAAIQHPAVVQVYDVVTEGGRPWIVMELLDARSLADMVIEDGPLAPRAVAKIGIALLGALEVAHAIGVLHRDVKPANVLICSDGRCVLTDFGVARMPTDVQLTTPGMVLGSPHFISPERAMGQDFGPPSDLFSLGVTLYTAVEGRPPFDRGDPIETMHAVVEDPPATPTRSGPLTRVLMGLLEKDPARRFDVHAARAMLRELLAGALASTAPVNTMTDPYAVVQMPRAPQPALPPPTAQPKPSGEIGGSAMLAPGESLTDRLAALRQGDQPKSAKSGRKAGRPDETSPNLIPAGDGPAETPTGVLPAQPNRDRSAAGTSGDPTRPAATPTSGAPVSPGRPGGGTMYGAQPPASTQPIDYGHRSDATQAMPYGGGAGNQWSVPGTGQSWASPATSPGGGSFGPAGGGSFGPPGGGNGTFGPAGGGGPGAGGRLVATVRGWPRKLQLAAAGGLVAVLLLGVVLLTTGGDDQPTPPPQAQPTTSAPTAGVEMQQHSARGISVLVPKGWRRATGGSYTDYIDPSDSGRKVRIITERWSSSSTRWAETAANGLQNRSASCTKPYNQIAMAEQELAGQPATELEYTCGEGEAMRHGIWRGVTQDGKAFSFYLTSTDARFAESRPIFDEMVKSFQLTGES